MAESDPISARALRQLVRGAVRIYYSQIQFEGQEKIPATGPVLFVANHANSLIDPVMIGLCANRPVHFLAKAPLFDVPVFGALMRAFGMVPAFRGSDDRSQIKNNTESLGLAAQFLAGGEAVGIFPEGKSHDALKVDTVRSGAARIAMQAVEQGVQNLHIVPIGINYQRKEQFRSAVWVRIGDAIHLGEWLAGHPMEERRAMRALTEEMDRRMQQVVIHLAEEKLEPLVDDLEVIAPLTHPFKSDPVAFIRQRKQIADAMNWHLATHRAEAQAMAQAIEAHREKLLALGLTMRTPFLRQRGLAVTAQIAWSNFKLWVGTIPAALGTLHHLVPFLIVRLLTTRLKPPGRMTVALTRLGIGLPIYAIWYFLVWSWGQQYFVPWVAWTWCLLMPFAGIYSLTHWRRIKEVMIVQWHQLITLLHRQELETLRREHRELRRKLAVLAADYLRSQPGVELAPTISWKWLLRRITAWTAIGVTVFVALVWVWVQARNDTLPELRRPGPDLAGMGKDALADQLKQDETVLTEVLKGFNGLALEAMHLKEDFKTGKRSYYRQSDDDLVRQKLFAFLNYRNELLRLIWEYQNFSTVRDESMRLRSFLIVMAAGSTLYQYSYEFVNEFGDSAEAVKKFNEGEPRWDIPPGLFDTIQDNLRQPEHRRLLQLATANYDRLSPQFEKLDLLKIEPYEGFHIAIAEARRIIHLEISPDTTGGFATALKESLAIGQHSIYEGQTAISTWLGSTRIRQPRHGKPLVQPRQMDELRSKLQPGDILFERQNWYLSRAFMPGYWAHTALYVGSIDDLKRLGLDKNSDVLPHWKEVLAHEKDAHPQIVLEAVPEGVRVTTLDHCLGVADSAAVLRPRLPMDQITPAIARAFSHLGKPYDFEFDFFSSDKLVCSELVYRAYDGPLHFTLVDVLGRKTMPPTELIHKFADEMSKPGAELEFVAFLDGDEQKGEASFSNAAELAKSIHRPSLTWLQSNTR